MTQELSINVTFSELSSRSSVAAIIGYRRSLLSVIILALLSMPFSAVAAQKLLFKIPQSSANIALREYAIQARRQILIPHEVAKEFKANSVEGYYSADDALEILLKGSGLEAVINEAGILIIRVDEAQVREENEAVRSRKGLLAALVGMLTGASGAVAEEDKESQSNANEIEEVIVTGTRRAGRTVENSPVPIDVFKAEDVLKQGFTDTNDILRTLSPSFNITRAAIADATTFIRPPTLRGLPPDQTLVMVNGKRRHRAALVQVAGGPNELGAQGPDVSQIPSIALKRTEILRDGASAQYGSDAIAGVINFILRDDAEGGHLVIQKGEFSEGDGESFKIAGNIGLALTDDGFLNISAEHSTDDPTNRGVVPDDVAFDVAAGEPFAPLDPEAAQPWGNPESEKFRLLVNGGVALNETTEVYFFGNYGASKADGTFFYRSPDQVDSDGAGPDSTGRGFFYDRSGAAVFDPSFSMTHVFPRGFTPRFFGDIDDFSAVFGVKGEAGKLSYDVSASYGSNEIDFTLKNSYNPSMGPNSPVDFDTGGYEQREKNFNIDFSYPVEVAAFSSPLNIAFGAEYRDEEWEAVAGEAASYIVGPYTDLSSGSNGFGGITPQDSGSFSRDSYAAYVDFEADVTDKLLAGLAIRFEDFSDFGSAADSKVSMRYQISDNFAIRAAAGTGFRAPTPGQSNLQAATSRLENGVPFIAGRLSVENPVAQALGAQELKPEESTSFSAGFTYTPFENMLLTVDYYAITVDDRIAQTSDIPVSPEAQAILVSQGLPITDRISFFTNVFETKHEGIEIVGTYLADFNSAGEAEFSLAANFSNPSFEGQDTVSIRDIGTGAVTSGQVIDRVRILEIEELVPTERINFSVRYSLDKFSALARASYYGEWTDAHGSDGSEDQTFGAETLFDLELSYAFNDNYTLVLGGRNITDEGGDEVQRAGRRSSGVRLPTESPFGFNGAFYYVRLQADF